MDAQLHTTPLSEIEAIHANLTDEFHKGRSRPVAFRKQQLSQLAWMVKDNLPKFESALAQDLGKPPFEVFLQELNTVLKSTVLAYNNVEKWAKPERVPFRVDSAPLRPKVRREPKGIVLIIGAFNYPAFLTLGPLSSAIAAGNAVVVKSSENCPAFSNLLAELFPKYLDSSLYRVVNGAVPETTKLLDLKWDHILYTGSGRVARIVATAAARYLTPMTLELGGKNPTIVDSKCDFKIAAKRILWGRFSNSGQTCTAPEYILVIEGAQERLIAALNEVYKLFYPDGALKSNSYGRMATDVHFKRVKSMLDATKGKVILGGETDEAQKYIAPTVVRDVTPEDSLMVEEIFGPILPVLTVKNIEEAIAFVNAKAQPLALYLFTSDAAVKRKVLDNTRSGAGIVNDVLIQTAVEGLPFGGVGESGYGQHTGKWGFDTFTHFRSTLDAPNFIEPILNNRYPPYTEGKLKFIQKVLVPKMPPRGGARSSLLSRILSIFSRK